MNMSNEIPPVEDNDIHEFEDKTEVVEGQNLKVIKQLRRKNLVVLVGLLIVIFLPHLFPRHLDFDPIRRSILFSVLIFSLIAYLLYINLFLFRRINISDDLTCIRLKRHNGHMDLAVFMTGLLSVIVIVNTFLASFATVDGTSMKPTLEGRDTIITRHIAVQYERFDVVIVKVAEGKYYVKRIVALPGEHLQIVDGDVLVDGTTLEEPHIGDVNTPCNSAENCDIHIPDGHVYILGDNRSNSDDSRSFGPISKENLYGRVFFRIRPLKDIGPVD